MTTISVSAAKNRLSELAKRPEAGEQITLTRRGQPVAQLAAADSSKAQSQAESVAGAFETLARLCAGISLDGDIKAIARQGLDWMPFVLDNSVVCDWLLENQATGHGQAA